MTWASWKPWTTAVSRSRPLTLTDIQGVRKLTGVTLRTCLCIRITFHSSRAWRRQALILAGALAQMIAVQRLMSADYSTMHCEMTWTLMALFSMWKKLWLKRQYIDIGLLEPQPMLLALHGQPLMQNAESTDWFSVYIAQPMAVVGCRHYAAVHWAHADADQVEQDLLLQLVYPPSKLQNSKANFIIKKWRTYSKTRKLKLCNPILKCCIMLYLKKLFLWHMDCLSLIRVRI